MRCLYKLAAGAPLLALTLTLASGCATVVMPPSVRVDGVQYFAQQDNNCGPSALASALRGLHIATSVDELTAWMMTPGLSGTLQQDLLGASRRAGALPIVIEPTWDALRAQLTVGRPIIVLRNLRVRSWPVWHYSVVTGLDGEHDRVRVAGEGDGEWIDGWRFDLSWKWADSWAVAVIRPGDDPIGYDPTRYAEAVAALEAIGQSDAAALAYDAGLRRWPTDGNLLFGAGNAALAQGRLELAAARFDALLAQSPDDVVGLNNLAEVLQRQGKHTLAVATIERAVALCEGRAKEPQSVPCTEPLRVAIEQTARDIRGDR